jgi:hypothetical protein
MRGIVHLSVRQSNHFDLETRNDRRKSLLYYAINIGNPDAPGTKIPR